MDLVDLVDDMDCGHNGQSRLRRQVFHAHLKVAANGFGNLRMVNGQRVNLKQAT